jgi:hypothetical protein
MSQGQGIAVGTIVARNYIPFARVLMDSVARQHPTASRHVLVVDGEGNEDLGGAQIWLPRDVGLSTSEVAVQSYMYSVMEFATALKPHFMGAMLREHSQALFLDPDTRLYSGLQAALTALAGDAIVLTPHRLTPPPLDGLTPDERLIKTYGVYNLGFLGLTPNARPFLDWWSQRLRRHSIISPAGTLYTDQRWVDLAPGYFVCGILRDPGYNVAPWNLDERRPIRDQGDWQVQGQRLVMMHFSGLRPLLNEAKSPTHHLPHGHRLDGMPEVLDAYHVLAGDYLEALEDSGYWEHIRIPYSLGNHGDGSPISRRQRRLYRARVMAAESSGLATPPPPFGRDRTLQGWDVLERSHAIEGLRSGVDSDLTRLQRSHVPDAWPPRLRSMALRAMGLRTR